MSETISYINPTPVQVEKAKRGAYDFIDWGRDMQSTRLYFAQGSLYHAKLTHHIASAVAMRDYVESVKANHEVQTWFGAQLSPPWRLSFVGDDEGAATDIFGTEMNFPPEFWDDLSALHEMAHMVVARSFRDPGYIDGHGREFAGIFRALVRIMRPDVTDALEAAYRAFDIDWARFDTPAQWQAFSR